MSDAAARLGHLLATKVRAAAEARWLTTGVIVTVEPLTVMVDGAPVPVPALLGDYPGVPGEVVLLAVLRGAAAVGYLVIGKMVPAPLPLGGARWRRNTAAGGVDGVDATPANTGGLSGDAFDVVTVTGTASMVFEDFGGTLCYKGTQAFNGATWCEWIIWALGDDEEPVHTCGGRAEFYLTEHASATVDTQELAEVGRVDAPAVGIYATSTGALSVFPSVVTSPAGVVPLNQWFRLEYAFDFTPGAGTYEVAMYPSPSATTPTWSASGSHAWTVYSGLRTGQYTGTRWGTTFGSEDRIFRFRNILSTDVAALPGPA